jgi:hypothetical protein
VLAFFLGAFVFVPVVVIGVMAIVLTTIRTTHLGHLGKVDIEAVIVVEHLHGDIVEVLELIIGANDGRRERETRQYQRCDKYVEMFHGSTPLMFAGHPIRP